MRPRITALAAAPLLLLAACDGGTDDVVEASIPGGNATADAPEGGDDAASTSAPADDTAATTAPGDDTSDAAPEGGAEGQAAADTAKQFLLALVDADPAACGMMLSFSDTTKPMRDVEADLELCETQLPDTMSAAVEAQGLGEEGRGILEVMEINGADVQGDTAVIDQDNYSELFAASMGESTITLTRIDGEWFIDVDRFLQSP